MNRLPDVRFSAADALCRWYTVGGVKPFMNPQVRGAKLRICIGVLVCGLAANCMSPEQADDTALTARLAQAQMVVSGTVTAVDAPAPEGPPGLSMHNPQWTRATVAVDSVEKGTVPGSSATLFFPASNDIAWSKAPKLTKGQQGIWLIHTGDAAKGAPGPAVVDPLDSRPIGDLQRIRTLLKNSSGRK